MGNLTVIQGNGNLLVIENITREYNNKLLVCEATSRIGKSRSTVLLSIYCMSHTCILLKHIIEHVHVQYYLRGKNTWGN